MDTIPVIFEDSQLLVLNKPAGIVVDPSQTQKEQTLAEIVKEKYGIDLERSGIVHRLDKDTSGLILIAKNPEALENLQSQFKSRLVKKEYLALVHGFLKGEGEINAPIARNPKNREKFIVLDDGRESSTLYKSEGEYSLPDSQLKLLFPNLNKIQTKKLERSSYGKFTLVRCFPQTGRTHQIRVHLKHIGFPIVGDSKYAGRKIGRYDLRWCPRQFLHAAKIEFSHPATGERLVFESPLPEDLRIALGKLEQQYE